MTSERKASRDFCLAEVQQALAAAYPERECIVTSDRRLSWGEVDERTSRLARFFARRGLGLRTERADLANWECGQDLIGLYLYNSAEYLETMMAAHKCRAACFNLNYRYTATELAQVLRDLEPRALVFHASLAANVVKVVDAVPSIELLVQVGDEPSVPLVPGAIEYDQALEEDGAFELPGPAPDDLYVLLTGGTTGSPKAVLWRQGDIFVAAMNGAWADGSEFGSVAEIVERAQRRPLRALAVAPFMHGGGLWSAFSTLHEGGAVVIPNARSLVAAEVWSLVEGESITSMLIVGDAFAKPLVEELERHSYDVTSLAAVLTGGAALSARWKQRLIELIPQARIIDIMGSSETGSQATEVTRRGDTSAATGRFRPRAAVTVLDESRSQPYVVGSEAPGWLATSSRVPLGYLHDPDRTRAAFPVIELRRFAIAGDRARMHADGTIEVLGRDATVINTGGEKVFVEEVEAALKAHPQVVDAVVVGRPHHRWGETIGAIVQRDAASTASRDDVLVVARTMLAPYKIPQQMVFVDAVKRFANGKPDYAWACAQLEHTVEGVPEHGGQQ